MPFIGGSPPATGGGSRPVYTQTELMNESGSIIGTVTSGAVNAYGSWVSVGTTSFAVDSVFVSIAFPSLRGVLLSISYGATGGANMIADGMPFTLLVNSPATANLPVRIPSGQQVWCRTAATAAASAISVALTLSGPQTGFSFSRCEPMTAGTSVNSVGAVVNVDNVGTWVACGAPTANAYAGFSVYIGGNNDTSRTIGDIVPRIGTGAAGFQVDVFDTYARSPAGTIPAAALGPFYGSFAAGTQLWCRADAATATGDTANIQIIGFIA